LTTLTQLPEIALDHVTFGREGRVILEDISVSFSAGRVGIVGRNGSGKTTLSRVIAGLSQPEKGRVSVAGIDPARDRKGALSTVGILFQNPDHQIIFPTVIEEISFGLKQMGHDHLDAEKKALTWLADYGVAHWAEASVARLSQGQKQLVCLISVLAMQPKVLLLDEPFSGLDLPTRAQLARRLARYQGTLVHVTHAPEDLTGYDHVIWLDQGRVAGSGASADVLAAFVGEMAKKGEGNDLTDLSD